MAYQTQMNGRQESPIRGTARGVADVWHDALSLAELQGRLFAAEMTGAARRSRIAAGLLALACILALAGLPVLVVALGCLLIDAGLGPAAAFAIAGVTPIIVGIVVGAVGWHQMSLTFREFPRSRLELRRNFDWLKQTLRHES